MVNIILLSIPKGGMSSGEPWGHFIKIVFRSKYAAKHNSMNGFNEATKIKVQFSKLKYNSPIEGQFFFQSKT